jgi:arylsulfatase A-like enzyme
MPHSRKNILFLFPDQHRGDWLPYGKEIFRSMGNDEIPLRMDNLRRLMDRGVTFIRAATNSPLCAPARACLASGRQYQNCGTFNNEFCYPLNKKTFYSVLRERGYNVGGVGKFDLHKPVLFWGKDGRLPQHEALGFTHAVDSEGKYDLVWSSYYEAKGPYSDFLHRRNLMEDHAHDYIRRFLDAHDTCPTTLPEAAYSDNWTGNNALTMLETLHNDDRPWFLQVNFPGPHNPWDVTASMRKRWDTVDFPLPKGCSLDGEAAVRALKIRRNYAAMLENIDFQIGRILIRLKELGEYENTLIVYASDHGEMLGDRGRYFKTVPYRGAVHIPLVIAGPDTQAGILSGELAQLHDLAATFAEYGGGSMPEPAEALSLLSLAAGGEGTLREYQFSALSFSLKETEHDDYADYSRYRRSSSNQEELIRKFKDEFGPIPGAVPEKAYKFTRDWRCVITKTHKLACIESEHVEEELYHLVSDPWEEYNLAGSDTGKLNMLRGQLSGPAAVDQCSR